MSERCRTCDRPTVTAEQYDAHPSGCECVECLATCWGGSQCDRVAVDWGARVIVAESALVRAQDSDVAFDRVRAHVGCCGRRTPAQWADEVIRKFDERAVENRDAHDGADRLRARLAEAELVNVDLARQLAIEADLRCAAEARLAVVRAALTDLADDIRPTLIGLSVPGGRATDDPDWLRQVSVRVNAALSDAAGTDLLAAVREAVDALRVALEKAEASVEAARSLAASYDGERLVPVLESARRDSERIAEQVRSALAGLRRWVA